MAQSPKKHLRGSFEAPPANPETWTSCRYLGSMSDLGLSAEQAGFRLVECFSLKQRESSTLHEVSLVYDRIPQSEDSHSN